MLKRETRILGLSGAVTKDVTIIVGVVYRGGAWLDGIVTTVVEENQSYSRELERTIRSTKQFSQLHAVILSPELRLSQQAVTDLHKRIRIPILVITKIVKGRNEGGHASGRARINHIVNGRHVLLTAVGAPKDDAKRLFEIGCSQGSQIPEAVRVARILSLRLKGHYLDRKTTRA